MTKLLDMNIMEGRDASTAAVAMFHGGPLLTFQFILEICYLHWILQIRTLVLIIPLPVEPSKKHKYCYCGVSVPHFCTMFTEVCKC